MTDDEQRARTEHAHDAYERRAIDRELRERVHDVEKRVEKLSAAIYGGEDGDGLRHEIKILVGKVDQLLDSDRKRLPRWAVLVLWLIALAIGAAIAYSTVQVRGG